LDEEHCPRAAFFAYFLQLKTKKSRKASGRRAGCCMKKAMDGGKRKRMHLIYLRPTFCELYGEKPFPFFD